MRCITASHDNFLDPAPTSPQDPFCQYFSNLSFSMVTLEHLISDRDILVGSPEPLLLAPFYQQTPDYRDSVYQGLQRVGGRVMVI